VNQEQGCALCCANLFGMVAYKQFAVILRGLVVLVDKQCLQQ